VSRARRERLREVLLGEELDALLVTTLVNVRYLTGFTGSAAQVLVTADGANDILVTDGRYTDQAAEETPDLPVVLVPSDGWLRDALGSRPTLGLEAHTVPWAAATTIARSVDSRMVASQGLVEQLRQVKEPSEIALLRRACAIADDAFAELLGWLAPGMVERDVAVRLERAMVDRGAAERAFATIVASGPNSAIPHHRAADRVLEAGDLVKLDFGALLDGYHSDMTRTVSIGEPTETQRRMDDVVRAAQAAGVAAVRPGVTGADVDRVCRDVITGAGWGDAFLHGTGHGVGLDIHEDPRVSTTATATLEPGHVVTVEPGVYLPEHGGVRIEDTVVVTTDGCRPLTHAPKDLVI
jgi:Xaa-Pro aminopeptidase